MYLLCAIKIIFTVFRFVFLVRFLISAILLFFQKKNQITNHLNFQSLETFLKDIRGRRRGGRKGDKKQTNSWNFFNFSQETDDVFYERSQRLEVDGLWFERFRFEFLIAWKRIWSWKSNWISIKNLRKFKETS